MQSPTQIIWEALGRPEQERPAEESYSNCALCGASCNGIGVTFKNGISDSFSDYRDLESPGGTHCCEACVWSMQGRPPKTIRMWSILWREDGLVPPSREGCPWQVPGVHMSNKADLTAFFQVLLNPPRCKWIMTLADSGQIHLLPFAKVNMPTAKSWTIRLERNDIKCNREDFPMIVSHAEALYRAGFVKDDIMYGQPQSSMIYKRGINIWKEHGGALKPWFGSKQLELATFFLRKEK